MHPHRMPPFVANDLAPASIREARREISHGGWRSAVTWMVVAAEVVLASMFAMMAPFLIGTITVFERLRDPMLVTSLVGLGLAVLAFVWAESVRRTWKQRRPGLVEKVAPYNQTVADPRWRDTQALLLELRGPDPASAQAEGVYRLTLAMAEAFARRDRIAAAVRAASAIGEDGVESLVALLGQHDDALQRTLVDLKQTCAVALRHTHDATRATEHLLRDLNLRLAAGNEVESGGSASGSSASAGEPGSAGAGARDPNAERLRNAARRMLER